MFAEIAQRTPFDKNTTRESLIHETGHLLGFDERYRNYGPLSYNHPGFQFDLMAGGTGRSLITLHPVHIEAAARFGLGVAHGRDLADQAVRGIQIDSTGTGGNITQFDPNGQPNPAYQQQQTTLETELVPQFASQVQAAPPPPTPALPFYRPWLCIPP